MRIFTKSLLTLVLLCVAGVVSAQGTVKGWFEVDASCISREPGYTELQGDHPSRVEDGATVIYARSNEGVENYVAWDTQFFITIGKDYALKEGGKFRLRMKVKADNPTGEAATQSHGAPGSYNAEFGKIKAIHALTTVGFTDDVAVNILDKYPDQLSVGEKHRVALAQVLIKEPNLIVLDEPTGTMDPVTRVVVTDSILKARTELEQTFIIISHDMDFVLDVCDRAALMRGGKLLDIGTPEEIVDKLTADEKEDMLKENR